MMIIVRRLLALSCPRRCSLILEYQDYTQINIATLPACRVRGLTGWLGPWLASFFDGQKQLVLCQGSMVNLGILTPD